MLGLLDTHGLMHAQRGWGGVGWGGAATHSCTATRGDCGFGSSVSMEIVFALRLVESS